MTHAAGRRHPLGANNRLLRRLFCLLLGFFALVSLAEAAFAQGGLDAHCRTGAPAARILACAKIIKTAGKTNRIVIGAYISRAAAYRSQGDFSRALADLDEALKRAPKSVEALIARASLFDATGAHDRAIADYSSALAAAPDSLEALLGRAEAFRTKKQFDLALLDYDRLIKIRPDATNAREGRAKTYSDKGDFEKALVDFDQALGRDPQSAALHVERGSIYLAQKEFDRAIADFDAALATEPRNARAYLERSAAYHGKNELDRAKQDIEAALRIAPQDLRAKKALSNLDSLLAEKATRQPGDAATGVSGPLANPTLLIGLAIASATILATLMAVLYSRLRRRAAPPSPGGDQSRDGYLSQMSALAAEDVWSKLDCSPEGLSETEAKARLKRFGPNAVAREAKPTVLQELWSRARNPLNALLLTLACVSYFLGDVRAAVVISLMVVLAVTTAFVQEHRSNEAAARLRAMVHTTATVRRRPCEADDSFCEIPIEQLAPGDVVRLSAGDIIPADIRLVEAKDLFTNQSTLTGEAMAVEKFAAPNAKACENAFDLPNICFMGANVVSGFGLGVVLRTGRRTFFGELAHQIAARRAPTAFDKGIDKFTWLMIRFMAVMAPAVFLINGLTKHDWMEALLFAVAVAVGLTPEMLPMIVTVNLAKGAIVMSRKKVIVKRLGAIQNFGAMDVLCTDKTGTLTQDRIILKKHLDIYGQDSVRVLEYAYLNSRFQSGLKNVLDVAVLEHAEVEDNLKPSRRFRKIDEIPFDFERRRLSVVVDSDDGRRLLICKGAVEEVLSVCSRFETETECARLDQTHLETAKQETAELNADGFRVVAVAYKHVNVNQEAYSVADEKDLTLIGYVAFLDPPKETAGEAIADLAKAGVSVKILTGDNEIITRKICKDVGLKIERIALGSEIEQMSDGDLSGIVVTTNVFAKLSPPQKARVIEALHRSGHVVGYLGDGINDGPALKAADVGISVDTAVDIAKESADIILLEKNLLVLDDGVLEGRRTFANITKYIRMGASSNFGNMFSVLGASLFLPFLPMAPIQVLTNNLLYDFSQAAIPTDNVDKEYLASPRKWDISNIFKFMIFIGPMSSIFDYATYGVMLFVFDAWSNPALFQTGWFVESLLTQTLIIHIIRTARVPFFESRASGALILTTIAICAIGVTLPFTWVGSVLGFVPLPQLYWPLLFALLLTYGASTHLVKVWFIRKWGL